MGYCDHTIERLNQELKRRTRVVRIFPNRAACLRLVTALCLEQSEEWLSGRRYLDLADLLVGVGDGPAAALPPPPRVETIGRVLPASGH